MYHPSEAAADMHQRFKFIIVATALIHGAIIFYKLGSDQLILSTGQITESLSVRVLLEEAFKKPVTSKPKIKKKVVKEKKEITQEKSLKPKEEIEVSKEIPTQTPRQAFDSLILNYKDPNYPRLAIRRGITGIVIIRLFIRADGSMEKVLISKSSGSDLLDNSAIRAAKQWKFKPLGDQSERLTTVEKRIVYKIN